MELVISVGLGWFLICKAINYSVNRFSLTLGSFAQCVRYLSTQHLEPTIGQKDIGRCHMVIIIGIIVNVTQVIIYLMKLFTKRTEPPFTDIKIPFTEIALEKTDVQLDAHPYGDFTIKGYTRELKQGMKLTISLPPGTTSLIIAGWGMVLGQNRYLGSLNDKGMIGHLTFMAKSKKLKKTNVSLPLGASPEDLKLADANPIFSGSPPERLVNSKGFLGMVSVEYNPIARQFWDRANVWISEVKVPRGTKNVIFQAIEGSMNIVHIRAIHRSRIAMAIERFHRKLARRAVEKETRSDEKKKDSPSAAQCYEKRARAATRNRTYAVSMSEHNAAADSYVEFAHSCVNQSEVSKYLSSAANNWIEAAKAAIKARNAVLAGKYYIHAILAFQQAGVRMKEELVEEALVAMEAVHAQSRRGKKIDINILIKTWLSMGFICLQAARSPALKDKKVKYFQKAWTYYVDKIVKTILNDPQHSSRSLMFAQERLINLNVESKRLRIDISDLRHEMDQHRKSLEDALDLSKESV